MHITFRKIQPYLVPRDAAGIRRLCTGIDDPLSLSEHPQHDHRMVFCSPLQRARMSISATHMMYLNELAEITFDPFEILCIDRSQNITSADVRRAFLLGWGQDLLLVRRKKIRDNMLSFLQKTSMYQKEILVISHSFRMKIFQAYFTHGEDLFAHPELMREYIRENEKTFPFGGGFSVTWNKKR